MDEELMAFAQSAVELSDERMSKEALARARKTGNNAVIKFLYLSGVAGMAKDMVPLVSAERAREAALVRGFTILSQGNFSYLQKVEYLCPVGHKFFRQPKSFAQVKQPCPHCAEEELSRLQINVRLGLDHSQKYIDLIEYYKSNDDLFFLDQHLTSKDLGSNLLALGRFLLETSIETAHKDLTCKKMIEEVASWIKFDNYPLIFKASVGLGNDPLRHKMSNTPEWQEFVKVDGGRLEMDYYNCAVSRWGELKADACFHEFWQPALELALKFLTNKPIIETVDEESRELEELMKHWKSKK